MNERTHLLPHLNRKLTMGILADSLNQLIQDMKAHDEKMLRHTHQHLDDLKLNLEALKQLNHEIDSIDTSY